MSTLSTSDVFRTVRPDRSWLGVAYRLTDATCIVLALFIVAMMSPYPWWESPWQRLYPLASATAVVFFYLLAEYRGLYLSARGVSVWHELRRVWWVWFGTMLALLLLSFGSKITAEYPRRVILMWFLAAPLLLTLWRVGFGWVLRQVRRRFAEPERVAIIGTGLSARRLVASLLASPWVGMRIEGVYDDEVGSEAAILEVGQEKWRVSDNWLALLEDAKSGRVNTVFITLPLTEGTRVREIAQALADTACSVLVVPDMLLSDLLNARWRCINGMPVINVFETPLEGVDGTLKRALDLLISMLALGLAAIPMVVIACAIKAASPGPVFYRQLRYGLDGREIWVWKFRSMYFLPGNNTFLQAQRDDIRVTPIGRWLRRHSLDELPQLFNVLQGTMSIVGPRPHPVALNEQHRRQIRGYMLRHRVKPGMTGLAQINGWRGETDTLEKMEKRIDFDLEYIRNWSIGLDLEIIVKTMFRMVRDHHAF